MRSILGPIGLVLLIACTNPRNTKLPHDLASMDAIKPVVQKLKPEEQELFTGFMVRHTMGAAFGEALGKHVDPIPAGMTLGMAVEEQRAYLEKEKAREAEEKTKIEQSLAAKKAFTAQVSQTISIRLINIKVTNGDNFGISKRLNFFFELENKGSKTITGIKGEGTLKDRFGDQLTTANLKFEEMIAPGKTVKSNLGRSLNPFIPGDKKLATADTTSTTFTFTPEMVLFEDGSKAVVPGEE